MTGQRSSKLHTAAAPAATAPRSRSSTAALADVTNSVARPKAAKPKTKKDLELALQAADDRLVQSLALEQAEHDARIAEKDKQIAALQRIVDEANDEAAHDNTVSKPKGRFVLIQAMGLENDKLFYDAILRDIHDSVRAVHMDKTVCYQQQPPKKIVKLCERMRNARPFMKRFIQDWATRELAKRYLKHTRAYEKDLAQPVAAMEAAHRFDELNAVGGDAMQSDSE